MLCNRYERRRPCTYAAVSTLQSYIRFPFCHHFKRSSTSHFLAKWNNYDETTNSRRWNLKPTTTPLLVYNSFFPSTFLEHDHLACYHFLLLVLLKTIGCASTLTYHTYKSHSQTRRCWHRPHLSKWYKANVKNHETGQVTHKLFLWPNL